MRGDDDVIRFSCERHAPAYVFHPILFLFFFLQLTNLNGFIKSQPSGGGGELKLYLMGWGLLLRAIHIHQCHTESLSSLNPNMVIETACTYAVCAPYRFSNMNTLTRLEAVTTA